MATKRNPEERSLTAPSVPGEAAARPTGEEVHREAPRGARRSRAAGTATPEAEQAAPEAVTANDLNALASEYYGRLSEMTGQLNRQARMLYDNSSSYVREHPGGTFLAAVALGVLIGFLTHRD